MPARSPLGKRKRAARQSEGSDSARTRPDHCTGADSDANEAAAEHEEGSIASDVVDLTDSRVAPLAAAEGGSGTGEAISISSGDSPVATRAVIDVDDGGDAIYISDEDIDASTERGRGDSNFQPAGSFEGKCVGIRYYHGRVNQDEVVTLRRQPENQYDRNAIQVLSMQGGQVGHLPRNHASALAPYVDNGVCELEGFMHGPRRTYDQGIIVNVLADPSIAQDLSGQLARAGIILEDFDDILARHAAANRRGAPKLPPGADIIDIDEVNERSTSVDTRGPSAVIDELMIKEKDLEAMPLAEQPEDLKTKLLPFQLAGLRWMQDKERPELPTGKAVAQMWKHGKDGWYTNIVTRHSMNTPPALAKGGMLCDDMGLGKTLQTLALIISDLATMRADSTAPTLVVCPMTLMTQWREQVEQHALRELNVLIHHGTTKYTSRHLLKADIVLTSYGMVAQEFKLFEAAKETSKRKDKLPSLFAVDWRRVVLDEAHGIRNPKAARSVAVAALPGDRRWCLTGTSIVNSYNDLASYVRFVGWSGGLADPSIFSARITRPLKSTTPSERKGALDVLKFLLADLSLRRRKNMQYQGKPLLELPELHEYHYRIDFESDAERETYQSLAENAKALWLAAERGSGSGSGSRSSGHQGLALEMLLRLRQAARSLQLISPERLAMLRELDAHGPVVPLNAETRVALQHLLALRVDAQDECPICMETLSDAAAAAARTPIITNCKHTFCRGCIAEHIATKPNCPLCRTALTLGHLLELPKVELKAEPDADADHGESAAAAAPSSKIKGLLQLLRATRERSPDIKSVVFSQWTKFLDLIAPALGAHGIRYVRIDGSQSAAARTASIAEFASDAACTVLLASLGVASVGLNLTMASQVILTDPWWAPAIEDQAVDRLYRMGQRSEVSAYKLYVAGTVEEKVIEIQNAKRQIVAQLGGRQESRQQASERRRADIDAMLSGGGT